MNFRREVLLASGQMPKLVAQHIRGALEKKPRDPCFNDLVADMFDDVMFGERYEYYGDGYDTWKEKLLGYAWFATLLDDHEEAGVFDEFMISPFERDCLDILAPEDE